MSDVGEFIDDWQDDDEPCISCGCAMRWRLWRRYDNGQERVLHKCWECGEAWWSDA